VTFALSLFDLLTYTVPGSLYLGFFGYLTVRVQWIDFGTVSRTPTWLFIGVIVVLSYLLGYLTYPLGERANRLVPRRRVRRPRQEFLERVPAARGKNYVLADSFLLLSAIQLHDKDMAVDVLRNRAAGLMLRNSAPPLVLGFVTATVELIVSRNPLLAAGLAVLFVGGFFGLIIQERRLGYWASLKTLELCFWIPQVEDRFDTGESTEPPAQSTRSSL
jgi:hypothetical protein